MTLDPLDGKTWQQVQNEIQADFDGDGKTSPWEKLCYWIILGCVMTVFGMNFL